MKTPIVFVIMYQPPGPHTEYSFEFSEFLTALVLRTDKVFIVGDFNTHVDIEITAFLSLLD